LESFEFESSSVTFVVELSFEFRDASSHFPCFLRCFLFEFGDFYGVSRSKARALKFELFELGSEGRNFSFEGGGFSFSVERHRSRVKGSDIFVDFEITESTRDTEGEARVGRSRDGRTEESDGRSRNALLSFRSSRFSSVRDRRTFRRGRERRRTTRSGLGEGVALSDGSRSSRETTFEEGSGRSRSIRADREGAKTSTLSRSVGEIGRRRETVAEL
jgi:hypothetical protein